MSERDEQREIELTARVQRLEQLRASHALAEAVVMMADAADTPTPERLRAWAHAELPDGRKMREVEVVVHGERVWASYLVLALADALESTRTPEPK